MATPKNISVQKAFTLLCSFNSSGEWLSNAELSRRTGITEASVHRLTKTLEGIGAVVRNKRGKYHPGMLLTTLSNSISVGSVIYATVEDILVTLAGNLGGVIHVGVLESGMVTYVAKVGEPGNISVPSRVGAQQEAYSCALGKILLSGLRPEQLDEFLCDGRLIALTPQTITVADRPRAEIEAVRERNYAIDDREIYPWISCVAAPIRDSNGGIVAALSLTGAAGDLCRSRQEDIAGQLLSATRMISRKLFPTFAMMAC